MSAAPAAQGQALTALAPRGLGRGALKFAAVLTGGWLLWPVFGRSFEDGFQSIASVALGGVEFGNGGHAEFLPIQARSVQDVDQDRSWDARVRLHIDGVDKAHTVVVNPRRLAYLPLLVFTATVVALGLTRRRTLAALGVGMAALWLVAIASVYVTVAWLFARVPGLVYEASPARDALLQLLYEGFVTPIANKFIVSVLLAFVCARLVQGIRDPSQDLAAPAAPSRKASRTEAAPARRNRRKRKR